MTAGPRPAGPPLLVVAVALLDRDGRVCLQQRPFGKRHGGLWEFPGGKVDPGEAPEAALVREMSEELTIAVQPGDLEPCGFAASADLVILLYACRNWRGEIACVEAEALQWIAANEAGGLAMPPLDYPLVEQVARLLSRDAI